MRGAGVFVLGAGGHALSVLDAIGESRIAALVLKTAADAAAAAQDPGVIALAFELIDEDRLIAMDPTSTPLVNGIGMLSPNGPRAAAHDRFVDLGFEFDTVVHDHAVVSGRAELGRGVQVLAAAVVGPGARIGVDSIINTAAVLEHGVSVGRHVHIAPSATICGDTLIGDDTLVGAGATIIHGVSIGAGCTIGAGSVVVSDVPGGSTVAGSPAHPVSATRAR